MAAPRDVGSESPTTISTTVQLFPSLEERQGNLFIGIYKSHVRDCALFQLHCSTSGKWSSDALEDKAQAFADVLIHSSCSVKPITEVGETSSEGAFCLVAGAGVLASLGTAVEELIVNAVVSLCHLLLANCFFGGKVEYNIHDCIHLNFPSRQQI